ncbi:MAG: OmpA family protein [Pseudomonadota bacterium]
MALSKKALVITPIMALSACISNPEHLNPNAGPNDNRNQGAIIGGIFGAVAGLATADDDKVEGVVAGAAIGAGAGALIGARLDAQAAALRSQLDDRVQITNTGEELVVTMPQDILFAVDSASLRPDLQSDLGALAQNLNVYSDTTVDIIGHTDNTGDAGYNQSLSQRRASAVSQVLLTGGVAPNRVRAFGRGEDAPVADNLTDAGRAQNRRVEIIISPVVSG